MWGFRTFFSGSNETSIVVSSATEKVLSDAYSSVEKEIESLKQYDRGEKDIHAPDLRSALRSI